MAGRGKSMIQADFGKGPTSVGPIKSSKCVGASAPEVSFSRPRRIFSQPASVPSAKFAEYLCHPGRSEAEWRDLVFSPAFIFDQAFQYAAYFRATTLAAYPLDFGQSFGLAVAANFDDAGGDENNRANQGRSRQRDMAISCGHIWMEAAQTRRDHDSQNAEQQAHRERKQGHKESDQQDSRWDQVPAGIGGGAFVGGHRC